MGHDVENGLDDADFAAEEKAGSDGWVDKTTADEPDGLGDGCHRDAKGQSDADEICR